MSAGKKLIGKVAIVTGSSSGIGAGIATLFAQEGANVSLSGRNKDELEKMAKECEKYGAKAIYTIGDIGKEETRVAIVKNTVEKFGKLDILINNAGLFKNTGLEDWTIDLYNTIMDINLKAAFHLTSLCVPHLKKTKGNIVNISSIASTIASKGATVYCMSKAALDMFTKCAAAELGPHQVRVNTVNPGFIYTNIMRNAMPGVEQEDLKQSEFINNLKEQYALKRVGNVEEVARPVLLLVSGDASFMTGSTILVDGGLSCNLN